MQRASVASNSAGVSAVSKEEKEPLPSAFVISPQEWKYAAALLGLLFIIRISLTVVSLKSNQEQVINIFHGAQTPGQVHTVLSKQYCPADLSFLCDDSCVQDTIYSNGKLLCTDELKWNLPMKSIIRQSFTGVDKDKPVKDVNAPKRFMSAYVLFQNATREQLKRDNPGMTFGQLVKVTSDKYKDLTPEEKEIWNDRAAQDKTRYDAEMAAYVPPGNEEYHGSCEWENQEMLKHVNFPPSKRQETVVEFQDYDHRLLQEFLSMALLGLLDQVRWACDALAVARMSYPNIYSAAPDAENHNPILAKTIIWRFFQEVTWLLTAYPNTADAYGRPKSPATEVGLFNKTWTKADLNRIVPKAVERNRNLQGIEKTMKMLKVEFGPPNSNTTFWDVVHAEAKAYFNRNASPPPPRITSCAKPEGPSIRWPIIGQHLLLAHQANCLHAHYQFDALLTKQCREAVAQLLHQLVKLEQVQHEDDLFHSSTVQLILYIYVYFLLQFVVLGSLHFLPRRLEKQFEHRLANRGKELADPVLRGALEERLKTLEAVGGASAEQRMQEMDQFQRQADPKDMAQRKFLKNLRLIRRRQIICSLVVGPIWALLHWFFTGEPLPWTVLIDLVAAHPLLFLITYFVKSWNHADELSEQDYDSLQKPLLPAQTV